MNREKGSESVRMNANKTVGGYNIRIYHECEGSIDKSVTRITIWHPEACRVMINGDHAGRILLFNSHTNNGFFFLLNIKYHIFCLKKAPIR